MGRCSSAPKRNSIASRTNNVTRIVCPHAGPLLWDGYTWEGDLRLPLFARAEDTIRAVPRLDRDDYEPPIQPNIIPLTILQTAATPPTLAQQQAIAWLKDHEPVVCLAVFVALWQLFRHVGREQWQREGMSETFLRLASTLDGLRQTVRCVGVTVFDEPDTPRAYTGFEFAADWAPWEGLGVIMQGTRFVGYHDPATE